MIVSRQVIYIYSVLIDNIKKPNKFTYTVTRLTSTLIKSVKCYKNDYREKK